ncbi:hypothetical protein EG329_003325 [Mollisiaceae sp. DMI_Dod_QoI]|nr:hypothetical protein EG329_003325 [Helotiales sp. DMI_Dod_QoI]
MPNRPWIPLFPTRLQNTSESPTSPASPLTQPLPGSPPAASQHSPHSQLIPPPRLHLRTLIPSPPLPAEYLKAAPPIPHPWIWRCHLCRTTYRLGVTSRCLRDGHYFCSVPSPPPSPALPASEEFFSDLNAGSDSDGGTTGKEILGDLNKLKNKKGNGRQRPRKASGCRSEFDFASWSKYNIWRRQVAVLKYETWLTRSLAKELRERKGTIDEKNMETSWKSRDCWKDCDFPSECHNERKAEREWEKSMKEMRESEEKWAQENEIDEHAERPESALDIRDFDEGDVDNVGEDEAKKQKDFGEEMVVEMENLGPLGTDCDGLGEENTQLDYTTKRRKGHDASIGSDSPPSSPLKVCSFGFADAATGCQVWNTEESCSYAGKQEERDLTDDNDDVQMKEVLMAKSMLLRTFEKDATDEIFGDEDEEMF